MALRKLASQTIVYGFSYIAGRMLNFFLVPFYTRIFLPAEYGVVTEFYAYITFLAILFSYGFETAYFYFANKEKTIEKDVASTSALSLIFTSLGFAVILSLFSVPLSATLGYPAHPEYVIYSALILMFDTIAIIPFAFLRHIGKSLKFALTRLMNIILTIGFNLFFLLLLPQMANNSIFSILYVENYGIGYVFLSNVLASALTLLFLIPEFKGFNYKFDKLLWIKMLRYSWPLLILGFAGMINETIDRVLLKYLLPGSLEYRLSQVGIYGACYKLSIFMTLAITSFRYAAEPFFFSRMHAEDAPETYAKVMKYFVFVTSGIFLCVTLFLPLWMLLLDENYREGRDIVAILLLANLFLGIFYNLSIWYKQKEKNLYGAYISAGAAVLTLLGNIIFIPYYGYYASAYTTLICYFSMAIVSYFLGRKFYPVPYHISRIGFYLILMLVIYGISQFIQFNLGYRNDFIYVINFIMLCIFALIFNYIEKPLKSLNIKILWRRN